jgi:hypothetical protein
MRLLDKPAKSDQLPSSIPNDNLAFPESAAQSPRHQFVLERTALSLVVTHGL